MLVVDDDPDFRKIARAALEEACLDVIAACDMPSAQAVLERVAVECLACVLVDYGLQGRDGIELVEWLNEHYPARRPA